MEKLQELNEGNAYVKNIYFGFENMLPTKSNNKLNKVENKNSKKKKSKNKSKSKKKKKGDENNIIIKPTQKIEEEVEENQKIKNKSKKNSKQKKKKTVKKEETIEIGEENDNNDIKNNSEKKNKSKSKKKKKSKSKKKKSKSKNKDLKAQGIQTTLKKFNNDISDYIENSSPQYNEIQDNAMNEVSKHIHDLSLTFMKPNIIKKENNFSKTFLKKKNDTKKKNIIKKMIQLIKIIN